MIGLGVGATALALVLASGVALAQHAGRRRPFRPRSPRGDGDARSHRRPEGEGQGDLRVAQGTFQAFRTQAKANREALKTAASAANPDPAAVGTAFLKVRADGKAMKAQLEGVHAEINGVLTPEQKAKFDGWIAAHKQQRRAAMRASAARRRTDAFPTANPTS